MAPSTITEISLLSETDNNEICSEHKHRLIVKYLEEKKSTYKNEISPYYDETVSRMDPKFLTIVRRWEKKMGFVTSIRWTNAIPILLFHVITVTWCTHSIIVYNTPKWQSTIFGCILGQMAGFGVTAGAHRLWTHRSYKAKLPMQILLLICYSVAGQNNLYNWVRDHRLHHKMSETSADPHNANRGFFFSHVGWLMMKKHPHVLREGKKIDMKDITNDPLLQFYNRYFHWFKLLFCIILPPLICTSAWNESWMKAIQFVLVRYMLTLNFTWAVNSFAHLWGYKPYDRNIMPSENWGVSILSMGEGWHNYHHTFPWDYKAAELAYFINITTLLLDMFARIGWVYDRKQTTPNLIEAVINKRNSVRKLSHELQS